MKFFDLDSPLSKLLTNVADLMILNFLFLLFSLPVVTFGASLTAMNFVTLQMAENKHPAIFDSFFKSFKQNIKQSTILWGIVFAMSTVFFAWYIVIENMVLVELAAVLRFFLYIIIVLFSMMLVYLFFFQAKFENSVLATIKNSFLMSIRHLFTTILSLAIIGGVVIIILFYPQFIGYGLVLTLVGFALISYVIAFLMERVFQNYL